MNADEILAQFRLHIEAGRNLSPHSVRGYMADVAEFARYLDGKPFGAVDYQTARAYIATLHGRLSSTSIARKVHALRTFYRFVMQDGHAQQNPFALLANRKTPKGLPRILSVDEVFRLLDGIDGRDFRSLRDRALLEFLYSCGARAAEAVALDWADLDMRTGYARLNGKGRKQRIVPVGEAALEALFRWGVAWNKRVGVAPAGANPVFISRSNARLSTREVGRIMGKRLAAAGLAHVGAHPHTLRHCCATHMLDNGAGILLIKELLGHASVKATQIYTHVSMAHVSASYDANFPRAF